MSDWDGKLVYVMGLGRFGGGVGVVRYLASKGARVRIGDLGDETSLSESIDRVQSLIDMGTAELRFGEHLLEDLDGVDVLVVNPAVSMPWKNRFVLEAKNRGIAVSTEIEMVYRLLDPDRVIAVTGSAGKSTTSAMAHHALRTLGFQTKLGGNIGGSLLAEIDTISRETWVVLELSSSMLHWLGESDILSSSPPAVGVITNCFPNHIDWHGGIEHYEQSKRLLLGAAKQLVLGEQVEGWRSLNSEVILESECVKGCVLPGLHNGQNAALAARAVCLATGTNEGAARDAAGSFAGLPHRLQLVCQVDDVRYFNDSKSTVPDATILAIDAMSELVDRCRIHLIAGGYDKGSDLSPIVEQASFIAGLYTIGATGEKMFHMAKSNVFECCDLWNAMKAIENRARAGDVVLLSPGCASWDQFENYEARGVLFAQLAKAMNRSAV